MKKLFIVLALISSQAFAVNYQSNTSNFVISDMARDGSRVYYNCDSVEDKVEKLLTDMGAIVKNVRCSGGINRHSRIFTPAFVRVSYDTLSSEIAGNVSASIMTVNLNERSNCHINNTVFKAVKKNFEISSVNMRSCFRPSQRTMIQVDVLK